MTKSFSIIIIINIYHAMNVLLYFLFKLMKISHFLIAPVVKRKSINRYKEISYYTYNFFHNKG